MLHPVETDCLDEERRYRLDLGAKSPKQEANRQVRILNKAFLLETF